MLLWWAFVIRMLLSWATFVAAARRTPAEAADGVSNPHLANICPEGIRGKLCCLSFEADIAILNDFNEFLAAHDLPVILPRVEAIPGFRMVASSTRALAAGEEDIGLGLAVSERY